MSSPMQINAAPRCIHTKPKGLLRNNDPTQLQAEAHNAVYMAVFYLRQPQANTTTHRKAVQALATQRDLSATPGG